MLDNLTLNIDKNVSTKSALLLSGIAVVGVGVMAVKSAISIRTHKAKTEIDKQLAEEISEMPEAAAVMQLLNDLKKRRGKEPQVE